MEQISTGIGFILAFNEVRQVTTNVYPAPVFAGYVPILCGLIYIILPIAVIYSQLRLRILSVRWARWSLGLTLIQLLFIMFSATGSVAAVLSGAYLDGTVIPRWHIWDDQNLYVFLVISYAAAVVDLYTGQIRPK